MTWTVDPKPARSVGILSTLINAISATRACSMLIRASTRRWRSFAAWYSAFSRRSPSSRARLISFGSSSFSSWLRVASSSSNFLINRSFMARSNGTTVLCFPTPCSHASPRRISSRNNPNIARYRAAARGEAPDRILLDGPHLVADALAAGLPLESAAIRVHGDRTPRGSHADGRARAHRRGRRGRNGPGHGGGRAPSIVQRHRRPRRIGPPPTPDACTPGPAPLVLIAHDVQDPGNLGAIVRAAEAGHATSVIAAGACADPFGWKALRGSSGSALRLPIGAAATTAAAIADARRARLPRHRHCATRRALVVRRRPPRRRGDPDRRRRSRARCRDRRSGRREAHDSDAARRSSRSTRPWRPRSSSTKPCGRDADVVALSRRAA